MQHNFLGRIQNFPTPKDPFTSLYEAISNSFQAINENSVENGKIQIKIERQNSPLIEGEDYPIKCIYVIDNGIGFNDKNMVSFRTFDSDYKREIGGKGIGRLNWLKVFSDVEITSVYKNSDSRLKRKFSFSIDKEIYNDSIEDTSENIQTVIYLKKLKEQYYKKTQISLSEIANKIIEHFTSIFAIGTDVILTIEENDNLININEYFRNEKYIQSHNDNIKVGDNDFELKHIFLKNGSGEKHKIYVCAQKRVVKSYSIPSIDDLPSHFDIDGQDAVYQCFVSGDALDHDVNQERSEFNTILFEKTTKDDMFGDQLNIYSEVTRFVVNYLDKFLEPYREEKMEMIQKYIYENAPEYRYLLRKSKPELEKITLSTVKSKKNIDLELYKINQKINLQNFEQVNNITDFSTIEQSRIDELVENITDGAKSELVSYVVKRKLVIELLGKMLEYENKDKYFKEKELHKLFFPMNADDSTIDYDQHNLWLIDERLAYSYKFFSDKPLRQIFDEEEKEERPDGLFLDAVSFTDSTNGNVNNVTVVEFKRPGRDDYSNRNSPIDQVYNYIELVKQKTVTGQNGEVLDIDENTRFTVYIIADLTESLKRIIKRHNMSVSSTGHTYFIYNDSLKVFIEIIPYSSILDNSEKRNKIFLKKLELS
jgi:hypothetical protein